jgi:hypothetical protein
MAALPAQNPESDQRLLQRRRWRALILLSVAQFMVVLDALGGSYLGDILGPSLLAGAGLGLASMPITIAAVAGIQEREAGLASGLINTSQRIGGALGLAVLATIADSRTNHPIAAAHGNRAELPQALTEGFQSAFLGARASPPSGSRSHSC